MYIQLYIYIYEQIYWALSPMSCGAVCELEATMVYLRSLKEHLKPKLAVSENVANGNINKRIAEALEADMDSRES